MMSRAGGKFVTLNEKVLFCLYRHISTLTLNHKIHAEEYLVPSQTSKMEPICENSEQLKVINYFRKKAPS